MEEEEVVPTGINTDLRRPASQVVDVPTAAEEQIDAANLERDRAGPLASSTILLPDTVARSFRSGGNFGYQIYKQIDRAIESGPIDPAWENDKEEWIKTQGNAIPAEQAWRYRMTRNMEEATGMVTDAAKWRMDQQELSKRWGVSTFVAGAMAGLVDVDLPLTFMGMGAISKAAKAGYLSSSARRVMAQAGVSGVAGSIAATGDYMADPNSDWTIIPLTGIANAAIGGALGALGLRVRSAQRGALDELGEAMADGHPRANERWHDPVMAETSPLGNRYDIVDEVAESSPVRAEGEAAARKPVAIEPDEAEFGMDFIPNDAGSVGARKLGNTGPGISTIQDPKIQTRIRDAQQFIKSNNIATDWADGYYNARLGASPGMAKAAEKMQQAIDLLGVGSDFTRMMNTNSAVAQTMAYNLFENSGGILRNNSNAARVGRMYEKDLGQHVIEFEDMFTAYAKQNQAGFVETNWNVQLRDKFNREIYSEMMARRWDNITRVDKNNPIHTAADALDRLFEKEVAVMKGRQGEVSLHGADNMKPQRGYIPQKWSGRNISKMIGDGIKRNELVKALGEAYMNMHPNMVKGDATIYAKAVINRAEKQDSGVNSSLMGLLQADGRTELAETLRRNGMPERAIDKFIERMTGIVKERGKVGSLKARTDVDARFTASNGIKIMDMLDTDLSTMLPQRVRKTAGLSALARKGITSKADWDQWVEAMQAEIRANGPTPVGKGNPLEKADDLLNADRSVDPEMMDHLYAYFSGAPLGGGLSPLYARMRKLTNLGLLNKLGLTQAYEAGNTMAAVGMGEYLKRLPDGIRGALKDQHSPLMQEMKFFNVFQPEERLFRSDLTFEFEKRSTQHEYLNGIDRLLNKGQQLQGYTSGFFHVRRIQQHIAISATADRLARHFKSGGLISDARLADMGFDAKSMAAFKDYIDNGVVEFENGSLKKLNFDQWKVEDREDLIRVLNGRTDQLVMRALAGESSYVFHKDGLAQLFFHLKSFALMTMEKQFLRNVRLADGETLAQFAYGMGVTGALAMARNTIDGRYDRNEPLSLARTAFGMSHMTGWLPMWTDPVANLLGMDGLSGYASRGDFIGASASVSYANNLAGLVALPFTALNGMSNSEINSLASIPLAGNFLGASRVWNAFKDDPETKKKEALDKPSPKKEPVAKAVEPSGDNALAALAASRGWDDGFKYVRSNREAGMTDAQIAESLQ